MYGSFQLEGCLSGSMSSVDLKEKLFQTLLDLQAFWVIRKTRLNLKREIQRLSLYDDP